MVVSLDESAFTVTTYEHRTNDRYTKVVRTQNGTRVDKIYYDSVTGKSNTSFRRLVEQLEAALSDSEKSQ